MQMLYRLSYVGAIDGFQAGSTESVEEQGALPPIDDVAERPTREDAPSPVDLRMAEVELARMRAPQSKEQLLCLSMQN